MCSDWTDGHFSRALTIDINGFASLEPSPLNVVWPLTSMVFQWFLKFSRQCSTMVWKTFCHTMCVNPFALYKWQAIRCPPKAALDDTFFFFIAKSQGRIGCRTQLSVRTAISSASNHKLSLEADSIFLLAILSFVCFGSFGLFCHLRVFLIRNPLKVQKS